MGARAAAGPGSGGASGVAERIPQHFGFVALGFSLGGPRAFIRNDILNLALKLDVIIAMLGPLRVTPPRFLSLTRAIFPGRKCD